MVRIPMQFPQPVKLSPSVTRWKLSDLEVYEARCAGCEPPDPRDSSDERYLSARQVADRYSASTPSIWRWCQASRSSSGREVPA